MDTHYSLQISHWRGICNVLQENGIELMIAKVPATSSAAQRAEVLLAAIEEQFPGREVNLVGHSMVSLVLEGGCLSDMRSRT